MGSWLAADTLLASKLGGDTFLKSIQQKNQEELARLQDKIADAEANHGETELSDALRAKATYLAKIGEKVRQLGF